MLGTTFKNLERCVRCTYRHRVVSVPAPRSRRFVYTHPSGSFPQFQNKSQFLQDPDEIGIARQEIQTLIKEIRENLSLRPAIREIAVYNFDGRGRSFRPLITLLMAKAVNHHLGREEKLLSSQREIVKIIEMLHSASLIHDDIIDEAETRRGRPAAHVLYSYRKAVMVGNFLLSESAMMAARLKNDRVFVLLCQVLIDLVDGEFMQLDSEDTADDRFSIYIDKSFKKTASLIAFCCKVVALLGGASEEVQDIAFQYGKNFGIAYQLVDDLLDFTSTQNTLGKPNLNDIKSGLATAPVLFACEKFPELSEMITRRFQDPDDLQRALEFVRQSDGLEQTKILLQKHCQEAVTQIGRLVEGSEQRSLMMITNDIIDRAQCQ